MKIKRLFALLLSVCMVSVMFAVPAEAFYSDYPERWNAASYDSEIGRYIANIAAAQDTKTRDNLGYADAWCAKFAMDCGEKAGTTALNPPQTGVYGNKYTPAYYENLIAAGGKEISASEARAGDIVFFDTNKKDGIDHVEIVYDNRDGIVYTVGGNTGKGAGVVNKRTINPGSAGYMQQFICNIVRPNYYTIMGDVNGDRQVTTADAQVIVNAILGKGAQLTPEQAAVADMNWDGQVTTADAQQIINNILGK